MRVCPSVGWSVTLSESEKIKEIVKKLRKMEKWPEDALLTPAVLVQGVKDRIGLKSSDVGQGMKICIHGQFHILN